MGHGGIAGTRLVQDGADGFDDLDVSFLAPAANIGGRSEKRNIEVVETICAILDQSCPGDPTVPHRKLITFVKDRPGHDRRYAIDARKIERDLGWKPRESFETGMRKTVEW